MVVLVRYISWWLAVVTYIGILIIQTYLFIARAEKLNLKSNQILERAKQTTIAITNPYTAPKKQRNRRKDVQNSIQNDISGLKFGWGHVGLKMLCSSLQGSIWQVTHGKWSLVQKVMVVSVRCGRWWLAVITYIGYLLIQTFWFIARVDILNVRSNQILERTKKLS